MDGLRVFCSPGSETRCKILGRLRNCCRAWTGREILHRNLRLCDGSRPLTHEAAKIPFEQMVLDWRCFGVFDFSSKRNLECPEPLAILRVDAQHQSRRP